MTATNHVITGAVIGAAITNPIVALPVALFSHVVLDLLPHFGEDDHKSRRFIYILATDMAFALSVLLTIFFLQPEGWQLMIACGILAASPDIWWLPYWIWDLQGKKRKLDKPIGTFLSKIQWGERPWGLWLYEAPWFFLMAYIFLTITS